MEVDYISRLPEHILHYILSFLTTDVPSNIRPIVSIPEIARTSILSKTWYQVWNHFQILEFDFFSLFRQIGHHDRKDIRERKIQELYSSCEQMLLSRRKQMINFNKFTIQVPGICKDKELGTTMNRWIGYAIDGQVKELKVSVGPFVKDERFKYNVPECVLSAKFLQVLYLCGCKLNLPCSDNVKLPSLRKLSLSLVCADDNLISKFLSGCPLIQELTFADGYGVKKLELFDLVKLEKIHLENLEDLERLKIDLPSLQFLQLEGPAWPPEVDFSSCKNLKKLSLSYAPINDKWLHQLLNKIPLLQDLSLFDCYTVERIKISSSHLLRLSIGYCKMLINVEIRTPCLCKFWYSGDIIPISVNDSVISDIHLRFKSNNNIDMNWYARLIKLLKKFNHCCSVLNLYCKTGKSYIVPRELRQIQSPPLYNIKELNLNIWKHNASYPTAKLVDAMLWIAPHLESLSIDSMTKSSFKFSYKQPTNGEDGQCYKSRPVSCWWKCIKNVKVKQISHVYLTGKLEEERNYDFDEDAWEKIESGLLDWVPDSIDT